VIEQVQHPAVWPVYLILFVLAAVVIGWLMALFLLEKEEE